MKLTIGYLYYDLMNIYGDTGNIISLQKRSEWRKIETEIINISIGSELKANEIDIYFFGGGQDQSQKSVAIDLVNSKKGDILKTEIERGVPLLSICGGYQLLGQYYKPSNYDKLQGVGLFPVYTEASTTRMIGNIVIESKFGKLVGFENHSGKTYFSKSPSPLGNVIKGFGNNGEDKTEGCIHKNAIGCYMHGSLLPKNPTLADWMIKKALEIKYSDNIELDVLNDSIENLAQEKAISKFS